jgi:Ca-activated chloride channel family protein
VEDIEAKVSGLYAKVSHPVLANLKLVTTGDVRISEVYPPQLPDLFHGQQLTVLGRYTGKGASAVKLTGQVGKEGKEFVYELTYPDRTGDEKEFVEQLWARRKVGYLLDQIRANGEKKELVEEVVSLAKKYGITTPYTSYLIVPDGVAPVVTKPVKPVGGGGKPQVGFGGGTPVGAGVGGLPGGAGFGGLGGIGGFGGGGGPGWAPGAPPPVLRPADPKAKANTVENFARFANAEPGQLGQSRMQWTDDNLKKLGKDLDKAPDVVKEAADKYNAYNTARGYLNNRQNSEVQAGRLGVDLSVQTANLRNQCRLELTAQRRCGSRNVMEVGGVWIDEGFNAKTKAVVVKAQSNAYFRILEKHPEVKEVFRLGNHLVWVTPSGTALVVDTSEGKEELQDKEIEQLFAAAK